MGHFILHVKHQFAAARALRDYEGRCANTHGHNFKVQLNIITEEVKRGYQLDYYEVKMYLSEVAEPFDHQFLNEIAPFDSVNPTTENIAKYFYQQLVPYLAEQHAKLQSVTVWETDEFGATYSE
jgi:6-pyruvoyltetrahydropterin/6-carboxytetrahydropterin synthase